MLGSSVIMFQAVGDINDNDQASTATVSDPRKLSDDGVCGNCNAQNAHDDSVCCLLCKNDFHALCFTVKENKKDFFHDNACTRSFLNGFNQSIVNKSKNRRFGSFVFVCDLCLTKHENSATCNTNDRVNILDNRVTNLAEDVTEIKRLLKEAVNKSGDTGVTAITQCKLGNHVTPTIANDSPASSQTNPTSNNQSGNLWLDTHRVKSLLVVAKDANVEGVTLEKTVIENGIQVQKKYVNKNGDTVIVCPNQQSRDNLKEKLTSAGVTSNLLKEPKERYPTISVVGIPSDLNINNKDVIYNTFLSQNPYITDCLKCDSSVFEILSVKPTKANENIKQVIIKLSDDIRYAIKNNNNKLFYGLLSCPVYDQLYVKRCHKCQGFGHYAKECSHTTCCGICASDSHETLNCAHKDSANVETFYSCGNCLKSGKTGDVIKHPAYSNQCPTYCAKQEKLKASLSYHSKN